MAQTIDIANELESVQTVDTNDLILGYSAAGNKHCYFPISSVLRGGYACRRWNVDNSSPVGEAVGNLDYLRNLPSLLGLGCYLVDKNHGRRKLSATNHYKFADGSTAALDGSMGDYMWGWGTTWYYAEWEEGTYHYEAVGLNPIPGKRNYRFPVGSTSALGVSVMDRDSGELVSVINTSARYRGGNNDSSKDSAFNTQLGRAATGMNAAQFGAAARLKGKGWEGYWFTFNAAVGILFRVIFGNRNVQSSFNANKDANGLYQGGLGPGVTDAGSWWTNESGYNYYPFLPTSAGVELADACGVSSYNVKTSANSSELVSVPVFFGLKNFYGYLGRWGRGELIKKVAGGASEHYVASSMYQEYSMSSLDGLVIANVAPAAPVASTWYYPKQISMNRLSSTPTVLGATTSTFYADGYYNDNAVSGLRVPARGGYADRGGSAGLECLAVRNGVTTAHARYGSPLCEAEEDVSPEPIIVAV